MHASPVPSRFPFGQLLPALLATLMALLLALLGTAPAAAQLPVSMPARANNIAAELVAQAPARPGEELTLAILFTPEPRWHGYWLNPGDAGYGMTLEWSLPEGWQAGEPLYPVPERLLISGLMNHVYEGQYAVLVPLRVPASASGIAPLQVEAEWLACTDEICVPESATLTLRVPVAQQGAQDPRFDNWLAAIPPLLDQPARFALGPQALSVAIPLPPSLELADPHLYLATSQLVDYAAPQRFRRAGAWLVAEIPRKGLASDAAQLEGILQLSEGEGLRFTAMPGAVPAGGEPVGTAAGAVAPLWLLLGGALLGGLLLNLMPCVFPILSLKALTLARSGESAGKARAEALAYTAGVVLACLALGGLLLALRAGGTEIGWAFQLQEPGVVVSLLVLAVAITANFAGLYELPSLSITRAGGRSSAFATGLLAAFVATPCTGPFMAAAIGAALLLPPEQALLLFAALGLGLALPFLALGFVPALRRLIPRPGPWMDKFRRVLAVPMGLTALALLWLAWRLGGAEFALGAAGIALAVLAVLALLWGRRHQPAPQLRWAAAASGLAAIVLVVSTARWFEPRASESEAGILAAAPFNETALARARASGQPVFVWFTADWCLTCKVNESVAIEREATRAAFEQAGVVAFRGDWTSRDPAITRFLTDQGAAGVPLYLWYAPGDAGEVLPQVLTPSMLTALAEQG